MNSGGTPPTVFPYRPFLESSGSDSPKLSGGIIGTHHLTTGNYSSGQLELNNLSPASGNGFNLAAFRSPGFLGAHGFAFGGNFGGYREHSPAGNTFDGSNQTTLAGQQQQQQQQNSQNFNNNSSSPINNPYSDRTSPNRDGFLSDYYHNNNTSKKPSEYGNGDGHVSDRQNNHSFGRDSESPELQTRSSPVDSSRSYPSQKSDGYHSPHQDSIGSRSPENLSSGKQNKQSSALPDMLDHHKLPLSFLGPPLAALHSMTEMKSGGHQQTNPGGHNAPNPHGIDTILSRPPPVTSAGINALTNGGIPPRFSIAAAAAGMAQYLSQSQNGQLKAHSGQLVDRSHLYWPGLQGLVTNPMAWRDRLTSSMSASLSQHSHMGKDGKKKHTRPTFSGQQIFALEKTFEQTKYLAGPERSKLAYALGMTESQVKLWFQNRRTKWRKKHAAEMATAKRKQEELGDGEGDCSEAIDSDSESLDLGDNNSRKRCRMDDDMQH